MTKLKLLARKVAIAFGVGVGAAVVIKAPAAIDALETQNVPELVDAGKVLLYGAAAGGLRALVALLTAFVPTDSQVGANLIGKFKDSPPEP